MNSGTITGNTSTWNVAAIMVNGGEFTMNGGTISNNTVTRATDIINGAGVYITGGGTFTMVTGTISGNTINATGTNNARGAGVAVSGSNSTFSMRGGTISGNTVNGANIVQGGGVSVATNSTFSMTGGNIHTNTISSTSTNVSSRGGGVYIDGTSTFTKTGNSSIIRGSDGTVATRNIVRINNVVQTNRGSAVAVASNPVKLRENAAIGGVNLNSGTTGGWD